MHYMSTDIIKNPPNPIVNKIERNCYDSDNRQYCQYEAFRTDTSYTGIGKIAQIASVKNYSCSPPLALPASPEISWFCSGSLKGRCCDEHACDQDCMDGCTDAKY